MLQPSENQCNHVTNECNIYHSRVGSMHFVTDLWRCDLSLGNYLSESEIQSKVARFLQTSLYISFPSLQSQLNNGGCRWPVVSQQRCHILGRNLFRLPYDWRSLQYGDCKQEDVQRLVCTATTSQVCVTSMHVHWQPKKTETSILLSKTIFLSGWFA